MKFIKYVFITLLAVNIAGCKPTQENKTEATEISQPAKLKIASIDIKGMTCEIGCAKTIESKIAKLEGVTASNVNFEAEKGTFTYDSNKASEEKIIKTINNLLDGKTYSAKPAKSCNLTCKKPCCKDKNKECKTENEKPCCTDKK